MARQARSEIRGPGGALPLRADDRAAQDLALLIEGETSGRPLAEVLAEFGCSRSAYYEKLHRFRERGLEGLAPLPPGPHGPWRRTLDVVREIVGARLADGERSAAAIAQDLRKRGVRVSERSVERTLSQFGLTRRAAKAALAIALVLSSAARADPFPTRAGTSGLLDVPDAQALDLGAAAFGMELRLDRAPGAPQQAGPSPLSIGLGLGYGLEAGASMRQGGLPGDPRPSPLLFGGALKLQVLRAFALQASLDRMGFSTTGALDAIASSDIGHGLRAAATAGVENFAPRAGGALALRGASGAEAVLEARAGPGGALLGGALRWSLRGEDGISLAAQWQPRDRGLRLAIGFSFASGAPRPRTIAPPPPPPPPEPKPAVQAPAVRVFRDEVPRLRIRIKLEQMPGEDGNRHLQSGAPPDPQPQPPPELPR